MSKRVSSLTAARSRQLTEFLERDKPVATIETATVPTNRGQTALRFARYASVRLVILFLTVALGVYITLLGANLGGRLDEVRRGEIRFGAGMAISQLPNYQNMTREERLQAAEALIQQMETAAGLDQSIFLRTAQWVPRSLIFDLGDSRSIRSIQLRSRPADARNVRLLIMERLPNTLLLLGGTNLIFFFTSISAGLFMTRKYGSRLDKLIALLSPTSAVPGWFYGIFLIAIFAGSLHWLPYGGMYPSPPPESRTLYALAVLKHMILPFAAVFLSVFFYTVYNWRTFFLIYSDEDYVEMAKAKGLLPGAIQRRYILRPTLPTVLTNLGLLVASIWTGSIILERLFAWPGLGDLYFRAIRAEDTAVLLGLTVTYAYFLAATFFLLDVAYAIIDPRITIGSASNTKETGRNVTAGSRFSWWPRRPPPRQPAPVTAAWQQAHRPVSRPQVSLVPFLKGVWRTAGVAWSGVRGIRRYPSAMIGLGIIGLLVASSIYAFIRYPHEEAVRLWRVGETELQDAPRYARPLWVNFFSRQKLPETISLNSLEGAGEKEVALLEGVKEINLTFDIDYHYDVFPNEPVIYLNPSYRERVPQVTMTWWTPDGREIRLGQVAPRRQESAYHPAQDTRLARRLQGVAPQQALFADPAQAEPAVLKGVYQVQVQGLFFEEDADLEARFLMHGYVHGWAGTDHRRRDLAMALLWGTPIALAIGLVAALSTTFLTMAIAATGVWLGGAVDTLVQRLTEVQMVLPVFPILAMFTLLFTVRIWEVMALAILFGIFSTSIKTYRALFLQVKESPYIEAACAYGAGDFRIIFHYLIPRALPVLIPQIVILVPSYVFLEASLAFLGLSDISLPTWGKIINDAHMNNALLNGHYYWMLQPAFLLVLTGMAFAMLGFTLDRVLNPRLQQV